jgi:VWFA-related protein
MLPEIVARTKGKTMYPRRTAATLAFTGLVIVAFAAIGTEAQAPAAQPGAAASSASDTILHANANLVLVDVVVTDKDKPVHGLDKSRFHIFEDGHEQVIASFDEHRPPELRPPGSMPLMKRTALPANTFTNIPDYPASDAVDVLLLDGLNTPLSDQMNIRTKMIDYIGKIKPGTSLAIFGLSSQLRMIAGFSTDLGALSKALKNPRGAGQVSTLRDQEQLAQQAGVTASGAGSVNASGSTALAGATPLPGSPQAATSQGPGMNFAQAALDFQARMTSFQMDQRVTMTLEAFQELARYLSGIPGRKNIIWFSGSFPGVIAPEDASGEVPSSAIRDYVEQVQQTTDMLAAARMSIYPVDARGLMPSSAFSAVNNTAPAGDNSYVGNTNSTPFATQLHMERSQTIKEQDTMQQIAAETGGRAFIETNDFTNAVAEVVENGSSYYTIAYVPSRKKFDGKFHTFDVRLDKPSYKLAYRRGYYADDPEKASADRPDGPSLIAAASQFGAPLATQISFVARVLPATDPLLQGVALTKGPVGDSAAALKGPAHRYVVDLVLDLHGLALGTLADGSRQANIEFAMVAYDAEGARVNYLEHAFNLTLRPDRFDKLMASGVPIRAELDLPEGQGSIRIAIHDISGGRAGSLEVPVLVGNR